MAGFGQLRGGEGSNVRVLRPFPPANCSVTPSLTFKVENLAQIRIAFGDEAAAAARWHLQSLLEDSLSEGGEISLGLDGTCVVHLSDNNAVERLVSGGSSANWIDTFCDLVALMPCMVGDEVVHVFVTGGWNGPVREAASAFGHARYFGQPVGQGEQWAARYRGDMALVASSIAALECGIDHGAKAGSSVQLALAWQAVRRIGESTSAAHDALYYQVRPLLIDHNGRQREFSDARTVLERMGFAALVDGWLVDRVLRELDSNPHIRLGIGISAHSAGDTSWWQDAFARLKLAPDAACRLIIEVTETAPIPDMAAAANLIRRMQRLGCRIAIDNFGLGFASIRELIALMPDIVRLDPFFLSATASNSLVHLAGLAQSFAPTVVATGVESQEQSALASGAGLIWQQGSCFGGPSIVRPWRFGNGAACLKPAVVREGRS